MSADSYRFMQDLIDLSKINLKDYLTKDEVRAFDFVGVTTLQALSDLLSVITPESMVEMRYMSKTIMASTIMFCRTASAPYHVSFDLWFDNFRLKDKVGVKWYHANYNRYKYLVDPAVQKRKKKIVVAPVNPSNYAIAPESFDRDLSIDTIDTVHVGDNETQMAEEFMIAFYGTKTSTEPFDAVKAGINLGMFSQAWVDAHKAEASKRAAERLSVSRKLLERQGTLGVIQSRMGMDVETARDTLKMIVIGGLTATETVWKKKPDGTSEQVEVPDWRTRGLIMKQFKDIFGITKEEMMKIQAGLAKMPASKEEAETDLVDLIVRTCTASQINVEELFYRVRDKITRVRPIQ